MLKGIWNDIKEWVLETARTMRREFNLVVSSPGTMLFFFALPLAYPIVYALIYNPEVTRDMPVAVVDNCRTASSREFVRHADATQAMKIYGYAANLQEAREWMNEKKVYAVIEIPADYARKVGRGDQGNINFYSEMSLLLRYRTFLSSLTELQMATDTQLRQIAINTLGLPLDQNRSSIKADAFFLGDTQQGFASFILPGIVVLILQQSMILGITFLGGWSQDRRRLNGGLDPLMVPASPSAMVIGKTLCYVSLYLPLTLYVLHFIPVIFSFPHEGAPADYLLFMFPLLTATALLGITLQIFVTERESAFIVVVFTSVAFLFLSGLTWPRYAMQPFWQWVGDIVPATWGINGFIRINSNGATLAQQARDYHMLWWLTLAYFTTSYLVTRWKTRRG
ncbi:MAG: ABC transporter permease [Muribaculaceae bacterium]|nr:ABC transporter permease [Muribaculaceae bacterium]MDE6628124.1 ABC transporter permease [Muribaculaceae bacterium]